MPPRTKDIPKLSSLAQQALKLSEWFLKVEAKEQGNNPKGTLNWVTTHTLRGRPALMQLHADMTEKMSSTPTQVMQEEFKIFKQYDWLLSEEQRAEVQGWQREVFSRTSLAVRDRQLTDGAGDEQALALINEAANGGSSSSSTARVPGAPMTKRVIKSNLKETAEVDKKNLMLRMFGPKP